jgi:methyl-accepting chemotaxis protein
MVFALFPKSFRAFVIERMAIWSGVLLFLTALFVAVEMIHAARLQGFLEEIDRLSKALASGQATALNELNDFRGQMQAHLASNERNKLLLAALVVFSLGIAAFLEYCWLVKPIAHMSRELAEDTGRLVSVEVAAMRRDDIGVMGRALLARQRTTDHREATSQKQIQELDSKVAAQAAFQQASLAFQQQMSAIVLSLEGHSSRMTEASGSLFTLSRDVDSRASAVLGATTAAATNVADVARTFGAFADGITRISGETARTADAAEHARNVVHAASTDTADLRETVGMIGQMVTLISDVATKTNLLALNATIEAARAGEHGRGFAVVASEVKQLAQQTSQATSDAGARLQAITAAADSIAKRILSLVDSVEEVDMASAQIAELMREQGDKTHVINGGTTEAAARMRSVTTQMSDMSRVVTESHSAANIVTGASGDLSQQAASLRAAVETFMDATKRIAA